MASRQLRAIKKQQNKAHIEQLQEELMEAWKKRDLSEAWAIASLLARNCRGPKKRIDGRPMQIRPIAKQYRDFLAAPSAQGGMSTVPISFDKEPAIRVMIGNL